jgi:hypothetical protein
MSRVYASAAAIASAFAAVLLVAPSTVRADVTVQEQTTFDVTMMKMHGSSTEYTTGDKQRRDNDMHCEGFMSMFCGNVDNGRIIRLDKDVEWSLEPNKKEYRETQIPTAAQRLAAAQAAQAEMEKMKQCPAMQQQPSQPAPDTSKCEMSPPKFEVKTPGTHATVAGYDSTLTQIAMTQSCVNKQTGDTCDFLLQFDTWRTEQTVAGADDRRTFYSNYAKAMGLDPASIAANPAQAQQMQRFLAPYADAMKQISSKAGDFKGFPLKTTLRIAFGGPNCAAAKNAQNSSGSGAGNSNVVGDAGQAAESAGAGAASGAAGSTAGTAAANAAGNGVGGSILGSAASAFGSKLVSGMFAKKNSSSSGGSSSSSTTPAASNLPPNMIQAAAVTTETTSISQGAIPASQFDIPAGWKLDVPPPSKAHEFTCPKS